MKKVNGNGTNLNNKDHINKRAQKKLVSQRRVLSLIKVAEKKGASIEDLIPYWNTYNCLKKVISADSRLYGRYCKNRFCTVCCGIRKAEIINKYLPEIKKWKNPQFVTITTQAVKKHKLNARIDEMYFAFNKFKDKFRKWHIKGKSIKFVGVKSLECNYNPVAGTYNPHFHLIVPDEPTAKLIVQEWQKYWGYKIANSLGQDIKPVTNPKKGLKEIIKYGAKTFTDPEMLKDKKASRKNSKFIYTVALHNILCAMKGHRIFERFGFNIPKPDKTKLRKITTLFVFQEWVYNAKSTDWLNENTEQPLTGYRPPPELSAFLEYFIDEVLE
ncbi:MAG TPA: protein rep [Bacteroidia bacterium]|jgi:hypothetical protein|nr:protein rep [Bacteroidia bacterium]